MATGVLATLSRPCSSSHAACLAATTAAAARSFASSSRSRQQKQAQPQTPATDSIELSSPATYVSESHDPWFNLSYEDWLLRNTPRDQPVLFFYRNKPCVVIGRNQNPWKETTPRDLRHWGIPLIRRRSGGGTVFHDMGNTNFSIILPRLLFTRAHGAELVARAVRERLGVGQCTVNERNDVIIRDSTQGRDLKMSLPLLSSPLSSNTKADSSDHVSGSAYKIIQHRAYHHGTMLISSSLDQLGKALKSSSPNIETKGIPSFRSPVTTLNHYLPPGLPVVTHNSFIEAVTAEFEKVYAIPGEKRMTITTVREEEVTEPKVWNGVHEMKTWEWEYGSSPEFSNLIEGELSFGWLSTSLTARHGLITSLTFHLSPPLNASTDSITAKQEFLDSLALSLVGKRYETLEGAEELLPGDHDPHLRDLHLEVIQWLRRVM